MASLKDTEQLTQELEELVGQLRSELNDGDVDFEKLVSICDQVSERADAMAETFSNVNDVLMERIDQAKSGNGPSGGSGRKEESRSESKAGSRS
jgi:hypothetical protein